MPFIATAIVGAVGLAGTTAGAILGGVINVGIAGGLAYASSALTGSKTPQAQTGIQTDVEMGGGQPRGCTYGRVGVAGYLAYANTFFVSNNFIDLVYVIGDGPHDGLDAVWVNGTRHTLSVIAQGPDSVGYQVDGVIGETGASHLTLSFYRGYSDQAADAQLVAGANPAGRWTAQDRLAGVCYVLVRGFYSEQAFPNGIPSLVFEVRGRRLYDWRRDSTAGGSGPHRWGDERTWEFSDNPIVQLYNYQRGTWLGGELTVGMGVPPVDLNPDAWTAAANACDERVAESDGSGAPRYRCGTFVSAGEEHAAVIQRFLDACAGALYESAGAYSPQAGVAQVVTYPVITDGDLVSGRPVRFAAKRPRSELANGVFGSFSDPGQAYELMAYAARTSPAAEAADGEIIRVQVDYPSVHHALQAQRLAQIQLGLSRLQATASITIGFAAVVLEPGDWIIWDSARFGRRTWLVTSLTQHADQTVSLNLREIGTAAYAWSEADEGTVSAGGVQAAPPQLINTVPMLNVSATTLVSDAGMKQPALRLTWAPVLDETVDACLFEYRLKAAGEAMRAESTAPNSGELLVSAGLQGVTAYEVRGTIRTTPRRVTVWTDWAEVTTSDLTVTAEIAPGTITVEMFQAGLQDQMVAQERAALAAQQAILDDIAMAVANVDAAAKLKADQVWQDSLTEVERVSVRVGEAEASIEQVRTVAASQTAQLAEQVETVRAAGEENTAQIEETRTALTTVEQSLSQQIETLEAETGTALTTISDQQTALAGALEATGLKVEGIETQVADVAASVTVTSTATAAPSGYSAAYRVEVKGSGAGAAYGAWMVGIRGSGAGATSHTIFRADEFVFMDSAGTRSLLSIDAPSGRGYLNVDIVAPKSITAAHVSAATVESLASKTGTLDVDKQIRLGSQIQLDGENVRILMQD